MANNNIITNTYGRVNTSFSGADAVATITPIGGKPHVIGEIHTLSYSIYRPMTPVYSLGRINPKGVVRGQRTIAGSIIFTVFDRHLLTNLIQSFNFAGDEKNEKNLYKFNSDEMVDMHKNLKTDEMPAFDINVTFMNEHGNGSTLNIYGVTILTEGQTMSIEDMVTENTMQYIAMDIDLMSASGLDSDKR